MHSSTFAVQVLYCRDKLDIDNSYRLWENGTLTCIEKNSMAFLT